MKYLLSAVTFCLVASQALAEVRADSKCPPTDLQRLLVTLEKAAGRGAASQKLPSFLPVERTPGVNTPIMLICDPNRPDANGDGCRVMLHQEGASNDKENFFLKAFDKTVFAPALEKVGEDLAAKNANDTDGELDFGNIFNREGSAKLRYFCKPAGQKPNRVWECWLSAVK